MKVTVYSTPTCPWCMMVKKHLKSNNIDFEDIDVSVDTDAAIEMVKKSGQRGVPVIDIDGNIVIGYNKEAIDQLLKL